MNRLSIGEARLETQVLMSLNFMCKLVFTEVVKKCQGSLYSP